MDPRFLILGLLGYALAAHLVLRLPRRELLFLLLNIVTATVLFKISKPILLIYLALVSLHYISLRQKWHWLALTAPIAVLITGRLLPASIVGTEYPNLSLSALFVGLSYMAFRLTWTAVDVRNGTLALPGFLAYLNFAFFPPAMSIGPIHRLVPAFIPSRSELGHALLRIVVGTGKYVFLANVFYRLTFAGVYNNPWVAHSYGDLLVASVGYYLYLYFNFSGFCDIGIGIGTLLGIRVSENFDNPLLARNITDYWSRWHITLSHFLRELVFTPLSKGLVRQFGVKYLNAIVSVAAVVTFALSGIWHGSGRGFLLWGLANGVAVAIHHSYQSFLKKWLKKDISRYDRNPFIRCLATLMTFLFVSFTLIFAANDYSKLRSLLP